MKRAVFFLVWVLSVTSVSAAEDPRQTAQEALGTFAKGCEQELATYCKDITPGKGRLLGCLYAYQDKLSPRCEYALYDAAAQLERAISRLNYTVGECRDDLKSYCAEIKSGEGRLLDCLQKNDAKLSSRCKTALKDGGLQ